MKEFERPSVRIDDPEWDFYLELPKLDDFVSRPHAVDPAAVLEWSEQLLPYFHSFPGLEARRLAEKVPEPFVLRED